MRHLVLKKRGAADAASAAALVAVIGALIILYIMFIPPALREELLAENQTDSGSSTSPSLNNTLIDERPGRLLYMSQTDYEHDIPSFNLFKVTNSEVIGEGTPSVIKNSWFDKNTKKMTFQINDIQNTDKVLLSFNAPTNEGTLQITLNNNIIFEQDIDGQIQPIVIPKTLLTSTNTLEFSVSGVGMAFWKTNRYSLQDIKIIGDVTDISRQESSSILVLKDIEIANLDMANLKFIPECVEGDVGVLEVYVNNIPVYSSVPNCRMKNMINVPKGVLMSKENRISFKTNKGSYAVDNIQLVTKLNKEPLMVYYFDLNEEQYKKVQNGTKSVQLDMTLVRTDEVKEANIIINGHITSMWTRGFELHKTIDKSWLLKGSNYVRLEPKSDLDVAKIYVYLN